jgi:hypothetical protein
MTNEPDPIPRLFLERLRQINNSLEEQAHSLSHLEGEVTALTDRLQEHIVTHVDLFRLQVRVEALERAIADRRG